MVTPSNKRTIFTPILLLLVGVHSFFDFFLYSEFFLKIEKSEVSLLILAVAHGIVACWCLAESYKTYTRKKVIVLSYIDKDS